MNTNLGSGLAFPLSVDQRGADARQRAAWDQWDGSARAFQQQLADQCRQVYGANSTNCDRYRSVSN